MQNIKEANQFIQLLLKEDLTGAENVRAFLEKYVKETNSFLELQFELRGSFDSRTTDFEEYICTTLNSVVYASYFDKQIKNLKLEITFLIMFDSSFTVNHQLRDSSDEDEPNADDEVLSNAKILVNDFDLKSIEEIYRELAVD